MQLQAALMAAAAQGCSHYINPMALAAAQMQHLNPLSASMPNGLSSAASLSNTTGKCLSVCRRRRGLEVVMFCVGSGSMQYSTVCV